MAAASGVVLTRWLLSRPAETPPEPASDNIHANPLNRAQRAALATQTEEEREDFDALRQCESKSTPLPKTLFLMLRRTVTSWIDDKAPSMGAALSYYTLFSLAPFLLIVIAVAGFAFGDEAARGEIFGQIRGLVGDAGAIAIQGLLESVNQQSDSVWGAIVGVGLTVIGATTVFGELQDTLDRIWRAPARTPGGLWGLLRARVLSFGLILGIGFLSIVSLMMSAGLAALQKWWGAYLGGWEVLSNILNYLLGFGLATVLFAMIYKIMPRVSVRWSDVWVGAAVTAVLFSAGRLLISLYLGHSAVASGFGAAGSLVVILVWVYYSAQVFLLGAEFTWIYAHTFGSRRHKALPAPGAFSVRAPERKLV